MITTHEAVLTALFDVLKAVKADDYDAPQVTRNELQPLQLHSAGWLALQDGEAGEPEVLLSPLAYDWEREAEIHLLVPARSPAEGRAQLAALIAALEMRLLQEAAEGALDAAGVAWAELGPPAYDALPIEGEEDAASAVCTLTLAYTTATAAT